MPYKKTEITKELAEELYDLCAYIDRMGNGGAYAHGKHSPKSIQHYRHKHLRDGILYYSTGHGWRVRKHPHWQSVFSERYGTLYEIPF